MPTLAKRDSGQSPAHRNIYIYYSISNPWKRERRSKKRLFFSVLKQCLIKDLAIVTMVKSKNNPALMPSLREKKRYIAFEIISDEPVSDFSKVSGAIWEACLGYLGSLGVSKAGIWVLPDKYSSIDQRGLLRVSRKEVDKVKAAFVTITHIGDEPVIVRSLGVSGMLNKAQQKYLNTRSA